MKIQVNALCINTSVVHLPLIKINFKKIEMHSVYIVINGNMYPLVPGTGRVGAGGAGSGSKAD